MIDELELVKRARPSVPPAGEQATLVARRALEREIARGVSPGPRRLQRWARGVWTVAPVVGVVVIVALIAVSFLGTRRHSLGSGHAVGRGRIRSTTTTSNRSGSGATSTTGAITAPPGQDNLTGVWSGHQSGPYNGKITISLEEYGWKHAGPGTIHAKLGGTIMLPAPAGSESVIGTWHTGCSPPPCGGHGDPIEFRTVSGAPVLYTGIYNSGHMSGSYRAAKGRGSWNASLGPP